MDDRRKLVADSKTAYQQAIKRSAEIRAEIAASKATPPVTDRFGVHDFDPEAFQQYVEEKADELRKIMGLKPGESLKTIIPNCSTCGYMFDDAPGFLDCPNPDMAGKLGEDMMCRDWLSPEKAEKQIKERGQLIDQLFRGLQPRIQAEVNRLLMEHFSKKEAPSGENCGDWCKGLPPTPGHYLVLVLCDNGGYTIGQASWDGEQWDAWTRGHDEVVAWMPKP